MSLEYKILWVDDNIDTFIEDEYINEIKSYLTDEGFIPKIETATNPEDFFTKLSTDFDLILTDFHMNDGDINGAEIVQKIRDNSVLTEILFYTAKAKLSGIDKISRVTFLQTEGSDHFETVVKNIIELIGLTIKKLQHIIPMRGLMMHETSMLDQKKLEILQQYIVKTENTDDLKKFLLDEIEEHFKTKLISVDTMKSKNNGLKKLSEDNYMFSSIYKLKTLQYILEEYKIDDFSEDYKNEIIQVRNSFAHAVLKKDEETGDEYFIGKKDKIFNAELCKEIRKNINKHKVNIEKLENEINSR